MNSKAIQEWLKLSKQTRRNIFAETAAVIGLPDAAVEKDWWVVPKNVLSNAKSIS